MRTHTEKALKRQLPRTQMNARNKGKMLQQSKKQNMITISELELERMEMRWTRRAFTKTLYFSIMALRDGFGFGKERLERFTTKFFSHYLAYTDDYVTLEDMHKAIKDETGFEIK